MKRFLVLILLSCCLWSNLLIASEETPTTEAPKAVVEDPANTPSTVAVETPAQAASAEKSSGSDSSENVLRANDGLRAEYAVVRSEEFQGYTVPKNYGKDRRDALGRKGGKKFVWDQSPQGEHKLRGFPLPKTGSWVVRFWATGQNDISFALSTQTAGNKSYHYEFHIGSWKNSKTTMRVNVGDKRVRREKIRADVHWKNHPEGSPIHTRKKIIPEGKVRYTISLIDREFVISYQEPGTIDEYELLRINSPHWIDYFGALGIAGMKTLSFSNWDNPVTIHNLEILTVETDQYSMPRDYGVHNGKRYKQWFVWNTTPQEFGIRGYELPSADWKVNFTAKVLDATGSPNGDLYIGLSDKTEGKDGYGYLLIVGGWNNSRVALLRHSHGKIHWQRFASKNGGEAPKFYTASHLSSERGRIIPNNEDMDYELSFADGLLKLQYKRTSNGDWHELININSSDLIGDAPFNDKETMHGLAKMRRISFSNFREPVIIYTNTVKVTNLSAPAKETPAPVQETGDDAAASISNLSEAAAAARKERTLTEEAVFAELQKLKEKQDKESTPQTEQPADAS